jgi:Actinobacteria/chloroflexi VLRF1 release factor
VVRLAAGGGRWIEVAPERLEPWLRRFDERHGVTRTAVTRTGVVLETADGTLADCRPPFPPLPEEGLGEHPGLRTEPLVGHVLAERTVGVLLVRLGGHAAGVFAGDRAIVTKVGSRNVHGRHRAGGSSQQRFARRRIGQARVALGAAADDAVGVLLPYRDRLDALVLGGDRRAVEPVMADPRLAPLAALVGERFLSLPEPRQAVLLAAPAAFRAVRIRVVEADPAF